MATQKQKTRRGFEERSSASAAAVGDGDIGTYLPWRPAPPREDECVRWECVDGRWVSIGIASGKHAGLAFVLHSGVLCEYVDSYEAALRLADKWRTL